MQFGDLSEQLLAILFVLGELCSQVAVRVDVALEVGAVAVERLSVLERRVVGRRETEVVQLLSESGGEQVGTGFRVVRNERADEFLTLEDEIAAVIVVGAVPAIVGYVHPAREKHIFRVIRQELHVVHIDVELHSVEILVCI